jgi:hypothetical protein
MTPFNQLLDVSLAAGVHTAYYDFDVSTVAPSGTYLVVYVITTGSEMPQGQKGNPVIICLTKSTQNMLVQHYPVTHFQLFYSTKDIHKSADAIHLILPSDSILRVSFSRELTTGSARCFFGISGEIL